jgi:predicted nucleic acid-binding protein
MKKFRLYLDTSVVSAIDTESERGEITREFFRIVSENLNDYEVVVSPVLLAELQDAQQERQTFLIAFLDTVPHIKLPKNQEAENLAWLYVVEDVLSDRHIDDLTHIAYAVISRCDYILSWNMKHLARIRTINRVNEVNFSNKFPQIIIVTPQFITGDLSNAD